MNRQIISFKANEQRLIKNERVSRYSSNKVAYVEAHFELGENWTGYDSVRAVWFTESVAGISTVLGRGGVCTVPTEVLKHRGKVYVNLVGSIAEGNALTDRLTTYPIVALTVDADSVVDGTETEPVTPSQFEQFVEAVRDDADRAEAGAETAGSKADRSAQSATESASSASASAGSAQSASESAVRAETARDEAESARDEILGMRAEATTLEAGSDATASYSDGLLTLGIPRGDRGATGEKGDKGDQGETGATGPAGADGFSPIVTVTEISGGHEVSIEDATQTQTFDVMDGVTPVIPWDSILPIDTASGDIASFPDGSELVPARSVKVSLEPIQDLNGYDKPWVGGAGKNKFDKDATDNQTGYAVNPRTFVIYQTSSGNYSLSGFIPIVGGQSYIESGSMDVPDIVYYDANKSPLIGYTAKATTAPNDAKYVRFDYWNADEAVVQFEVGSSATSFEPYSNICPISGRAAVVTHRTRTGKRKNLLPLQTDAVQPLFIASGTRICVSALPPTNGSNCVFNYYRSDRTQIDYWTLNQAVTGGRICRAVRVLEDVYFVAITNGTALDKQIELGTTATAYEPYQGNTYTTALGRTVYGGTLDVVSGVLTVDRAMVDLSTLNFNYDSSGSRWQRTMPDIYNYPSRNGNLVAEKYVADVTASAGSEGKMFTVGKDLYIYSTDGTTPPSGKLVYPLASPQTYQLTPTEIDLFHGQNNLWSDGEIEVEYNADIQLYIEKKLG